MIHEAMRPSFFFSRPRLNHHAQPWLDRCFESSKGKDVLNWMMLPDIVTLPYSQGGISRMESRHLRVRSKLLLVASCVALQATLVFPVEASQRYDIIDYWGSGVSIRTQPRTSATRVGLGYRGQRACFYFMALGQNVNNNFYWDYHFNRTTGVWGYSADYYMDNDGWPYGYCNPV